MRITLDLLRITNFKGIKALEINFGSKDITIEGANRSGKSTIFDAFIWSLFGKTSDDRAKFNIKPLDENNNPIHGLENDVLSIIKVDGKEIKINRTHRENWVNKRGESEKTLAGNETIYEWNDVKGLSQSEFNAKINNLIDEELFKLITNPNYFNSLGRDQKRSMLINLIGDLEIDYFSGIEKSEREIIEMFLNADKNLLDARKELSSKIKKIKDEMILIPSRIDEAERAKPEAKNWDEIENNIGLRKRDLGSITNQLSDISIQFQKANEAYLEKQKKLNEIKIELGKYQNDHKAKFEKEKQELINERNKINIELSRFTNSINLAEGKMDGLESEFYRLSEERQKLLNEYHQLVESDFTWDTSKGYCDKCGHALQNSDELKENAKIKFYENKELRLEEIKKKGLEKKAQIEEIDTLVTQLKDEIINGKAEITNINEKLEATELSIETFKIPELNDLKIIQFQEQIKTLENELTTFTSPDTSELKKRAENTQIEIDSLKTELEGKKVIESQNKRIEQLKQEEKAMSQEIADLQKQEFAIENFTRGKMLIVEKEVNKLFKFVQFRLFENQINGGQKEVCEAMVNGVPYSDVNTEGKMNAGLDIINVFSKANNVYAPIFIDNRESVSELIQMDTQIINLIVNPKFKELKISK